MNNRSTRAAKNLLGDGSEIFQILLDFTFGSNAVKELNDSGSSGIFATELLRKRFQTVGTTLFATLNVPHWAAEMVESSGWSGSFGDAKSARSAKKSGVGLA